MPITIKFTDETGREDIKGLEALKYLHSKPISKGNDKINFNPVLVRWERTGYLEKQKLFN